jgi:hypothetical protein
MPGDGGSGGTSSLALAIGMGRRRGRSSSVSTETQAEGKNPTSPLFTNRPYQRRLGSLCCQMSTRSPLRNESLPGDDVFPLFTKRPLRTNAGGSVGNNDESLLIDAIDRLMSVAMGRHGGGNDRINSPINSRFGFKSTILVVIIAIIITVVVRTNEPTPPTPTPTPIPSSLSSSSHIQHNFTINDSMQRGESLQLLAKERDDDATVLNRARDHFLIAESLAIAQNRRHDASHAHAAAADAALLRDAAADSLRNVVPLAPWLLGRTYSSDLFDDALGLMFSLPPSNVRFSRSLTIGLVGLHCRRFRLGSRRRGVVAAVGSCRCRTPSLGVARRAVAALRRARPPRRRCALRSSRHSQPPPSRLSMPPARLCAFLRLSKVAALSVARVGDADDRLVRVRATLVQTFPAPWCASAAPTPSARIASTTPLLATRLLLLALVVAIARAAAAARRRVARLARVDSDAYMMRFVACPCGVAARRLAPAVLDHLFSSFLPMLLPESPTQLASTGMTYPLLFASCCSVAPLAHGRRAGAARAASRRRAARALARAGARPRHRPRLRRVAHCRTHGAAW